MSEVLISASIICANKSVSPLSGINVINYYGPHIYSILGINTQTALMIIGISGALSIVYCTIGLYLLDRVGRVKPLIVSAGGCALALVVNAALSQHIAGANANHLRAMVAMNFVFSLLYTPMGKSFYFHSLRCETIGDSEWLSHVILELAPYTHPSPKSSFSI